MSVSGEVAVYRAELVVHRPSGTPIDLGGVVSYSPRRAAWWVRTRAEQVAQQLGVPCGAGVRGWLGERGDFERAVAALVAGTPVTLTVVDAEGCAYALVARPGGRGVGAFGNGTPRGREATWLAA
ncbi:hypothetical protein [Streptomyces sp. MspMP-M5]|uniref:hypothetical protein n=1 Tax=unclassified Streptomyces TaxID=2593676 RepID=UPI0003742E37|nr:hypothetical protein [Streptomyces sp. MspMP-M5]MYT33279.1 hypothetical protein [Streptomyces sp. SID8354]